MIILFSPAKQMFSETDPVTSSPCPVTHPLFLREASLLNLSLDACSNEELIKLMKMSAPLAVQTRRMITEFGTSLQQQALFAYRGTSFRALDAGTLTHGELDYAQRRLRILSGMYGYLRPFDLISPYRLEMKAPLPAGEFRNLTMFWKDKLNAVLDNEPVLEQENSAVINLASHEYSRLIDPCRIRRRVITVSFYERAADGLKTVGMYAKMARGRLLRRILQEKVSDAEEIKGLKAGEYEYCSSESGDDHWVFLRNDNL